MIFGCLDGNAPDFQKWSGELGAAFARASFPRWEQAFQFDYEVKANWKAYVENGLEGYHIPTVHDFLRDAIDLGSGTNHFEDHSSYTLVDASTMLAGDMPVRQIRFGHLFPNLIPVLSPIDFSYLRIDPVGPETIRLRGRGFDAGPDTLIPREVRAMGFDMTNRQDIAVVERVQRGLRARGLPQAVHSGLHEARVTHFEKMIEYALSA
jgi:choline monooxygenase